MRHCSRSLQQRFAIDVACCRRRTAHCKWRGCVLEAHALEVGRWSRWLSAAAAAAAAAAACTVTIDFLRRVDDISVVVLDIDFTRPIIGSESTSAEESAVLFAF